MRLHLLIMSFRAIGTKLSGAVSERKAKRKNVIWIHLDPRPDASIAQDH
jgi:hypothetical protein